MAATYWFHLPEEQLVVAPALHVTDMIDRRQFVLLYDLPDDPGLELDDPSLSWSHSFRCFYRYAPASGEAGVLHTPAFSTPERARRLRVRVQTRPSDAPGDVVDVALLTELGSRPAIIFAEES